MIEVRRGPNLSLPVIAGVQVKTGKAAPHIFPEITEDGCESLYVPFQGWDGGLWFDGPLVFVSAKGVNAVVLAGRPGVLRFDPRDPPLENWREFVEEEKHFSLKDSLIFAFQLAFGDFTDPSSLSAATRVNPFLLTAGNCDVRALLHFTMMRLAFPERRLFVDAVELSPPWKRLAQNLNIEIRKNPSGEAKNQPREVMSEEAIATFLAFLQKRAPYIPEGLARSLGIPL